MKAIQRNALVLALAGALTIPATTLLADEMAQPTVLADAVQASVPVQTAVPAERMQAMRARMMELRQTSDPDKRKVLIDAQMKDMEAMLQGMGPGQMQGGMMGSGMMDSGMMPGMMGKGGMMSKGQKDKNCMMGKGGMGMSGQGMQGGMGMMGQGMQGGMGMSGQDDMTVKRMEMMEKRIDMMQMMMQMRMGSGMQGCMGQGMQGGMGMPAR